MGSEIDTTNIQSSIKDFKCFYCNKYLSVSPVFLFEEIKVCGRCNITSFDKARSQQYSRQTLYEQVAKSLKFPCSFDENGCGEKVHWNDVKTHELNCNFKPLVCPMNFKDNFPNISKKCHFTGDHKSLTDHIKKQHCNNIHNSGQFTSKANKLFFVPVEEHIITACVIQKSNEKKYFILILKDNMTEDYSCKVEIYGPSKETVVTLSNNNLNVYKNQLEDLENVENVVEVDLTRLSKLKSSKKIDGKLNFTKKEKTQDVEEKQPKKKKLSFDEDMLIELECPVCNDYMIPPIYICTLGHSICNNCTPKVRSCPTCRSDLADTRNFTLEKLTTKVNYPCRYHTAGCTFVTTSDKIRDHEKHCSAIGYQCLLKCQWKGLMRDMISHIKLKHAANFIENDKVYKQQFITILEPFYILMYDDEVFRIGVKVITGTRILKFSVQHCPSSENGNKYKYKLEFIDVNSLGVKFEVVYHCQEVTKLPKDAWLKCLNVSEDITAPFLENNILSYKINILKV